MIDSICCRKASGNLILGCTVIIRISWLINRAAILPVSGVELKGYLAARKAARSTENYSGFGIGVLQASHSSFASGYR
jgi:hypothetical protein